MEEGHESNADAWTRQVVCTSPSVVHRVVPEKGEGSYWAAGVNSRRT
jgi:hypothetical protein